MKILIKYLGVLLLLVGMPLRIAASTEESIRIQHMSALRDCIIYAWADTGKPPVGENPVVINILTKYGFIMLEKYHGADGSFLDPWGSPYIFLLDKDGNVAIVSLGPKIENKYPSPAVVVARHIPKPNAN